LSVPNAASKRPCLFIRHKADPSIAVRVFSPAARWAPAREPSLVFQVIRNVRYDDSPLEQQRTL